MGKLHTKGWLIKQKAKEGEVICKIFYIKKKEKEYWCVQMITNDEKIQFLLRRRGENTVYGCKRAIRLHLKQGKNHVQGHLFFSLVKKSTYLGLLQTHLVNGTIEINGKTYHFQKGDGFIAKIRERNVTPCRFMV